MSIYQIKIAMGPVWRCIEHYTDATLAELHEAIQAVMDWETKQDPYFVINGEQYGIDEEALLEDFDVKSLTYHYLDHQVEVTIESELEQEDKDYPCCIDGEGGETFDIDKINRELAYVEAIEDDSVATEQAEFMEQELFQTILYQLETNNPPEVRQTLIRLINDGVAEDEATMCLAKAFTMEMFEMVVEGRPFSHENYVKLLKGQPNDD